MRGRERGGVGERRVWGEGRGRGRGGEGSCLPGVAMEARLEVLGVVVEGRRLQGSEKVSECGGVEGVEG